MEKRIEHVESGIVCDNPNCDFEDSSVTHETMVEWINRPCPKCGENLLTVDDYTSAKTMHLVIDLVNSLSDEAFDAIGDGVDLEQLKEHPLFKNAIGKDLLNPDNEGQVLNMTVKTHKGIHIEEIKKSED